MKSRFILRLISRVALKIKVDFKMRQKPHFITTQRLINKVVTDLEDYEAHKDDVIIYDDT